MAEKTITYSKKFGGMLASLTTFVCTAIIFFKSATINMTVLIHALSIVIPATVSMWFLGNLIGKVFDSNHKKHTLNEYKR